MTGKERFSISTSAISVRLMQAHPLERPGPCANTAGPRFRLESGGDAWLSNLLPCVQGRMDDGVLTRRVSQLT
jgi:hypothetical protein